MAKKMTGRDYRQLIKLHRETAKFTAEQNNEYFKALSKLTDNYSLTKYQPVDYDLFKSFISKRKLAAGDSLNKVKQLEENMRIKKEVSLLKQHVFVWFKEWERLTNQSKLIEAEFEDYFKLLEHNSVAYVNLNSDTNEIENDFDEANLFESLNQIDELEEYSKRLNDDRIKFKVRTILPINDLREDLKFYLRKNASFKKGEGKNAEIVRTINGVKEQQKNIMKKLELDYEMLNKEVREITKEISREELRVEEGIPAQAFDLDSPDDELKVSVLQEFFIIDFKYKEKLRQLNDAHKSILGGCKLDGWSETEHEIFQHVYEHYHSLNINLVNCNFTLRDLIFDRMKRSLERKLERGEFLKHEEWCDANKYYSQQQRLIVNEWSEARRSLLVKAEAIFAEGFEMIEQQRIRKEEKEKQLKICNELYEKVSWWRKQKFEALEIQQKIDEIIKRQNAEKTRVENERKTKKREQEKQAIQEYKSRLDAGRKQLEEVERSRLDKLKQTLNEQWRKDQERIEYRKEAYLEKRKEAEQARINKQAEDEMKEKRMEKFYDSVKPHVESDPTRLLAFTEAYLRKRGVRTTNDSLNNSFQFEEAKPLFNNFSFNEKQLNSDARLRIEARLRAAGLINNEYARSLISAVKPPTQPRKDQNSNSHWNGFIME